MDINDFLRAALTGARRGRNPLEDLLMGSGPLIVEVMGGGSRRHSPLDELLSQISREANIEDLWSRTLDREDLVGLQPKTARERIDIDDQTIFLGGEGFTDKFKHRHINFLIRHPNDSKADHWRLYSICPNVATANPFLLRNCPTADEAVRKANLLFDIGLGIITEDDVNEHRKKNRARKTGGPAGAPAESPGATGDC